MPEKEEELQPVPDSISITSSVLSSLVVRKSGFIQNLLFSNCWEFLFTLDVPKIEFGKIKAGFSEIRV